MDTSAANNPQPDQKPSRPPGVMPKHAQAWIVGGISATMIAILALTGGQPTKPSTTVAAAGPLVTEPSQGRIHDYQARIEEQTRELVDEQARLAQAKQTLAVASSGTVPMTGGTPRADEVAQTAADTDRQSLQREQMERNYRSLFASNVAASYRAQTGTESQRRDTTPTATEVSSSAPTSTQGTAPAAPTVHEGYRVFEGTVIETVLTNRLTGSFAGPVNCLVTIPVYSSDRGHVVIPQGSRVLGEVKRVDAFGQERLAVVFHRVIRPDGSTASLDQFQGLNQIGETGLQDQVNHHYLQVFGMSAAIGALAGFAQYNTRYSAFDTSASDAYRQGASASLAQSSTHVLDRYLNLLPTITIREGHRIKVYLSQDLWLPPYPTSSRVDAKE
jgi:type IV secretory pathway VirB10-like protein